MEANAEHPTDVPLNEAPPKVRISITSAPDAKLPTPAAETESQAAEPVQDKGTAEAQVQEDTSGSDDSDDSKPDDSQMKLF